MTIYNWRRTGYGPKGVRIGRYVRYEPEEVRSWFASLTERAG
jgi:predicted DNA-binding transcriptional regulator AlpA